MNKDESSGSSAMQFKSISVISGDRELFRIPRGWLVLGAAIAAWAVLIGAFWILRSVLALLLG